LTDIDTLFCSARLADGREVEIAVRDGQIVTISSNPGTHLTAKETRDLGHRLVLPGLVDGHIHLDKGFVGDAWKPHRPCTAGFDVGERVSFEKYALTEAKPIAERASALIALCASQGITHLRSHVDIDTQLGLHHFEEVAAFAW
jgi:cytosine/creatinine deaminase